MIISNVPSAPLPKGRYKAIVLDIREYKNPRDEKRDAFIYDLAVFTGERIRNIEVFVYKDGSSYKNFKNNVIKNYLRRDKGKLDINDHIGTVIEASFSIYVSKNGAEYLTLQGYKPYEKRKTK